MSECIAGRDRTLDGSPGAVVVWHLAGARGDSWWRSIKCGGGIFLPGHAVDREPTCPKCVALVGLSMAEIARGLLTTHRAGLRHAYEEYISRSPWVSFEVFELGVEILSEPDPIDEARP